MLCCMLCKPCAVFLLMFADVMPLTTNCMHTYVACTSTAKQRASTTLCFVDQVSTSQHRAQRQQASRDICDSRHRSTAGHAIISALFTPRTPPLSSGQGLCAVHSSSHDMLCTDVVH
jgi:hypothetical protein